MLEWCEFSGESVRLPAKIRSGNNSIEWHYHAERKNNNNKWHKKKITHQHVYDEEKEWINEWKKKKLYLIDLANLCTHSSKIRARSHSFPVSSTAGIAWFMLGSYLFFVIFFFFVDARHFDFLFSAYCALNFKCYFGLRVSSAHLYSYDLMRNSVKHINRLTFEQPKMWMSLFDFLLLRLQFHSCNSLPKTRHHVRPEFLGHQMNTKSKLYCKNSCQTEFLPICPLQIYIFFYSMIT